MANLIEQEQGSEEWLRFRLSGIGGSDANIIASYFMGIDYPYGGWPGTEIYKLWATKVGRIPIKPPKKSQSFGDYIDPKEHGKKTEILAREWYMQETGNIVQPAVLQHNVNLHLISSLDGYSMEDGIAVEIKCPKEPWDHRKALEGEVPKKYLAQLHHNWLVAAMPEFHFVSFYEGAGVIIPFQPDPKFMDELREAEETFWKWVVDKEFPLPAGDITSEDKEFRELVENYWQQERQGREIEAAMRYHRLAIMRYLEKKGARRITGCGARVALSVRPPTKVQAFDKSEFLEMRVMHAAEEEDSPHE